MGRNLGSSGRSYDVTATTSGRTVEVGEALTGSDLTGLVIDNGYVQVRFTPNSGIHAHLWRWDGSAYRQCMDATNGDWSYFGINLTAPNQIVVVRSTPDEVEVAVEWSPFDMSSYPGGGVYYRDWNGAANYAEGQTGANAKRISSVHLTKTVIVKRGMEGMFLGWHSDPRVGPLNSQLPAANNSTDYGERELGTGGATWVAFSSAGLSAHFPEWGADARWAAAEAAVGSIPNRVFWPGIDDADYSIWTNATVQATQATGFPNEQAEGPWWVADLHYTNMTADGSVRVPVCRYVVLRVPLEIGVWQFGAGAAGDVVAHFCNEYHDEANVPYRAMLFIGAFPYVTTDFSNEPTAYLKKAIARAASVINWDTV